MGRTNGRATARISAAAFALDAAFSMSRRTLFGARASMLLGIEPSPFVEVASTGITSSTVCLPYLAMKA